MKNFKKFQVLFFLSVSVLFIQCTIDIDPNEDVNNRLNGDWDVESFRYDGQEQISYTINTFTMEFTKETATTGETQWTLFDVLGDVTSFAGDYEIIEEGQRIEFEGDELNIDIEGDFLTIEGNVDGIYWEIAAEKD